MQKGNYVDYNDDPRLVNVSGKVKELEQEYDDIIWHDGVGDTRLETLSREIRHYKELQEKGVLYEPKF